MKENVSEFGADAYLNNEEAIAEYLTAVLQEKQPGSVSLGAWRRGQGARNDAARQGYRTGSRELVQGIDAWGQNRATTPFSRCCTAWV